MDLPTITSISFVHSTPTELVVSWTFSGVVDRFEVQYSPRYLGRWQSWEENYRCPLAVITDLLPGDRYSVRVRAHSPDIGLGPWAVSVSDLWTATASGGLPSSASGAQAEQLASYTDGLLQLAGVGGCWGSGGTGGGSGADSTPAASAGGLLETRTLSGPITPLDALPALLPQSVVNAALAHAGRALEHVWATRVEPALLRRVPLPPAKISSRERASEARSTSAAAGGAAADDSGADTPAAPIEASASPPVPLSRTPILSTPLSEMTPPTPSFPNGQTDGSSGSGDAGVGHGVSLLREPAATIVCPPPIVSTAALVATPASVGGAGAVKDGNDDEPVGSRRSVLPPSPSSRPLSSQFPPPLRDAFYSMPVHEWLWSFPDSAVFPPAALRRAIVLGAEISVMPRPPGGAALASSASSSSSVPTSMAGPLPHHHLPPIAPRDGAAVSYATQRRTRLGGSSARPHQMPSTRQAPPPPPPPQRPILISCGSPHTLLHESGAHLREPVWNGTACQRCGQSLLSRALQRRVERRQRRMMSAAALPKAPEGTAPVAPPVGDASSFFMGGGAVRQLPPPHHPLFSKVAASSSVGLASMLPPPPPPRFVVPVAPMEEDATKVVSPVSSPRLPPLLEKVSEPTSASAAAAAAAGGNPLAEDGESSSSDEEGASASGELGSGAVSHLAPLPSDAAAGEGGAARNTSAPAPAAFRLRPDEDSSLAYTDALRGKGHLCECCGAVLCRLCRSHIVFVAADAREGDRHGSSHDDGGSVSGSDGELGDDDLANDEGEGEDDDVEAHAEGIKGSDARAAETATSRREHAQRPTLVSPSPLRPAALTTPVHVHARRVCMECWMHSTADAYALSVAHRRLLKMLVTVLWQQPQVSMPSDNSARSAHVLPPSSSLEIGSPRVGDGSSDARSAAARAPVAAALPATTSVFSSFLNLFSFAKGGEPAAPTSTSIAQIAPQRPSPAMPAANVAEVGPLSSSMAPPMTSPITTTFAATLRDLVFSRIGLPLISLSSAASRPLRRSAASAFAATSAGHRELLLASIVALLASPAVVAPESGEYIQLLEAPAAAALVDSMTPAWTATMLTRTGPLPVPPLEAELRRHHRLLLMEGGEGEGAIRTLPFLPLPPLRLLKLPPPSQGAIAPASSREEKGHKKSRHPGSCSVCGVAIPADPVNGSSMAMPQLPVSPFEQAALVRLVRQPAQGLLMQSSLLASPNGGESAAASGSGGAEGVDDGAAAALQQAGYAAGQEPSYQRMRLLQSRGNPNVANVGWTGYEGWEWKSILSALKGRSRLAHLALGQWWAAATAASQQDSLGRGEEEEEARRGNADEDGEAEIQQVGIPARICFTCAAASVAPSSAAARPDLPATLFSGGSASGPASHHLSLSSTNGAAPAVPSVVTSIAHRSSDEDKAAGGSSSARVISDGQSLRVVETAPFATPSLLASAPALRPSQASSSSVASLANHSSPLGVVYADSFVHADGRVVLPSILRHPAATVRSALRRASSLLEYMTLLQAHRNDVAGLRIHKLKPPQRAGAPMSIDRGPRGGGAAVAGDDAVDGANPLSLLGLLVESSLISAAIIPTSQMPSHLRSAGPAGAWLRTLEQARTDLKREPGAVIVDHSDALMHSASASGSGSPPPPPAVEESSTSTTKTAMPASAVAANSVQQAASSVAVALAEGEAPWMGASRSSARARSSAASSSAPVDDDGAGTTSPGGSDAPAASHLWHPLANDENGRFFESLITERVRSMVLSCCSALRSASPSELEALFLAQFEMRAAAARACEVAASVGGRISQRHDVDPPPPVDDGGDLLRRAASHAAAVFKDVSDASISECTRVLVSAVVVFCSRTQSGGDAFSFAQEIFGSRGGSEGGAGGMASLVVLRHVQPAAWKDLYLSDQHTTPHAPLKIEFGDENFVSSPAAPAASFVGASRARGASDGEGVSAPAPSSKLLTTSGGANGSFFRLAGKGAPLVLSEASSSGTPAHSSAAARTPPPPLPLSSTSGYPPRSSTTSPTPAASESPSSAPGTLLRRRSSLLLRAPRGSGLWAPGGLVALGGGVAEDPEEEENNVSTPTSMNIHAKRSSHDLASAGGLDDMATVVEDDDEEEIDIVPAPSLTFESEGRDEAPAAAQRASGLPPLRNLRITTVDLYELMDMADLEDNSTWAILQTVIRHTCSLERGVPDAACLFDAVRDAADAVWGAFPTPEELSLALDAQQQVATPHETRSATAAEDPAPAITPSPSLEGKAPTGGEPSATATAPLAPPFVSLLESPFAAPFRRSLLSSHLPRLVDTSRELSITPVGREPGEVRLNVTGFGGLGKMVIAGSQDGGMDGGDCFGGGGAEEDGDDDAFIKAAEAAAAAFALSAGGSVSGIFHAAPSSSLSGSAGGGTRETLLSQWGRDDALRKLLLLAVRKSLQRRDLNLGAFDILTQLPQLTEGGRLALPRIAAAESALDEVAAGEAFYAAKTAKAAIAAPQAGASSSSSSQQQQQQQQIAQALAQQQRTAALAVASLPARVAASRAQLAFYRSLATWAASGGSPAGGFGYALVLALGMPGIAEPPLPEGFYTAAAAASAASALGPRSEQGTEMAMPFLPSSTALLPSLAAASAGSKEGVKAAGSTNAPLELGGSFAASVVGAAGNGAWSSGSSSRVSGRSLLSLAPAASPQPAPAPSAVPSSQSLLLLRRQSMRLNGLGAFPRALLGPSTANADGNGSSGGTVTTSSALVSSSPLPMYARRYGGGAAAAAAAGSLTSGINSVASPASAPASSSSASSFSPPSDHAVAPRPCVYAIVRCGNREMETGLFELIAEHQASATTASASAASGASISLSDASGAPLLSLPLSSGDALLRPLAAAVKAAGALLSATACSAPPSRSTAAAAATAVKSGGLKFVWDGTSALTLSLWFVVPGTRLHARSSAPTPAASNASGVGGGAGSGGSALGGTAPLSFDAGRAGHICIGTATTSLMSLFSGIPETRSLAISTRVLVSVKVPTQAPEPPQAQHQHAAATAPQDARATPSSVTRGFMFPSPKTAPNASRGLSTPPDVPSSATAADTKTLSASATGRVDSGATAVGDPPAFLLAPSLLESGGDKSAILSGAALMTDVIAVAESATSAAALAAGANAARQYTGAEDDNKDDEDENEDDEDDEDDEEEEEEEEDEDISGSGDDAEDAVEAEFARSLKLAEFASKVVAGAAPAAVGAAATASTDSDPAAEQSAARATKAAGDTPPTLVASTTATTTSDTVPPPPSSPQLGPLGGLLSSGFTVAPLFSIETTGAPLSSADPIASAKEEASATTLAPNLLVSPDSTPAGGSNSYRTSFSSSAAAAAAASPSPSSRATVTSLLRRHRAGTFGGTSLVASSGVTAASTTSSWGDIGGGGSSTVGSDGVFAMSVESFAVSSSIELLGGRSGDETGSSSRQSRRRLLDSPSGGLSSMEDYNLLQDPQPSLVDADGVALGSVAGASRNTTRTAAPLSTSSNRSGRRKTSAVPSIPEGAEPRGDSRRKADAKFLGAPPPPPPAPPRTVIVTIDEYVDVEIGRLSLELYYWPRPTTPYVPERYRRRLERREKKRQRSREDAMIEETERRLGAASAAAVAAASGGGAIGTRDAPPRPPE